MFNSRDANGQLPIHIAAKEGLLNNVQLLIDVSPVCIDCRDNKEQTPLILAAKNGFPHVVSHLLSKEANYAAKDTYDCTAFDWAVKRKAAGVVEVFLGKDYWKEVRPVKVCSNIKD